MPIASTARIHPTAILSPEVDIAEDVEVGPFVIIEGTVRIGARTKIRPHAQLYGELTLGCQNDIGNGVILGERPQHLQDPGIGTRLEIGDRNVFREYVTIHRGSKATGVTIIGNENYFMINSHIGHDSRVGNNCILANGALIAGHCTLQDRVFISGNAAIHQHVRMGRLSLLSGVSAATQDVPPFILMYGRNDVVGINVVGMRRAGYRAEQIQAAREAFRLLYRENLMLSVAVERVQTQLGDILVVQEMIQFIRESKRGVIGGQADRNAEREAA